MFPLQDKLLVHGQRGRWCVVGVVQIDHYVLSALHRKFRGVVGSITYLVGLIVRNALTIPIQLVGLWARQR